LKNIEIDENTISHHAICDLHGIKNIDKFDDVEEIGKILQIAAKKAKMVICGEVYKKFEPIGITYALLLSTSHFVVHIWPEKQFMHLDIFVCAGEGNVKTAVEYMCKKLNPNMNTSKITYLDRSIF